MSSAAPKPPARPTAPPHPDRRPVWRTHHGDTWIDDWEWLRDPGDPEVLAHLAAENAWTAVQTEHLRPLEDELFNDVKTRTQETDLSVPSFHRHGDQAYPSTGSGQYWYYRRTIEGMDYPVHCRVPATDRAAPPDPNAVGAAEQVLLDENAEAEGHAFFAVGAFAVSPDGRLLAYSIDVTGDERYDLHVRRLDTGAQVGEPVPDVGAGACWAGNEIIIYSRMDEAWRPFQVWRHRLGSSTRDDVLILDEPDEMFWLGADESRDRNWLVLSSGSKLTSEVWLVPTAAPATAPVSVAGRRAGRDYLVEVGAGELFILHNTRSADFEISRAPLNRTGPLVAPEDSWTPFLPPSPGVRWTEVHAYVGHVVAGLRRDGLTAIEILPLDGTAPTPVQFDEPVHTVHPTGVDDADTDRVRLWYASLTTPPSILDLTLATGELTTLKTTPVLDHPVHGPYDPSAYIAERIWATADDGTNVPVSVVRRREVALDGAAPALIYGYGAYEISIDPTFSTMRLSLLDRGFVYAIAHVRGGGELGRSWYDQGKLLHKRNTFTDFIAAGRHLVAAGYTRADRLAAQGGSAGGLLVGAVANLAPEAFRAIHAAVPFVDTLTTILKPELPLTVTEWEEWGDPLHDAEVYRYMKSYSPYENVSARNYPAILATTSLNDTRVSFVEPAKWVAALRAQSLDQQSHPILFRCEMAAGHGGVSGRYKAWREAAFEYAWLIDQVRGQTTV